MSHLLEFEPLDTLFFRNAKPFEAKAGSDAGLVFPPMPSVIYGTIRSVWAKHNRAEIPNLNTTNDVSQQLEITDFYLSHNGNKLFPLPADLLAYQNGKLTKLISLKPVNLSALFPGATASHLPQMILMPEKAVKAKDGNSYFLNETQWLKYLNGENLDEEEPITLNAFSEIENKWGNEGNDDTGTVKEGRLFQKPLIRLRNCILVAHTKGLKFEHTEDLNRLGGEGRLSFLNIYPSEEKEREYIPQEENEIFKIVLKTPAIFMVQEKEPEKISDSVPEKLCSEFGLTLLAASVHKPVFAGGWDMKIRIAKPMYKAVAAGSVFYFRKGNKDLKSIAEKDSISDVNAKEGFGLFELAKVSSAK